MCACELFSPAIIYVYRIVMYVNVFKRISACILHVYITRIYICVFSHARMNVYANDKQNNTKLREKGKYFSEAQSRHSVSGSQRTSNCRRDVAGAGEPPAANLRRGTQVRAPMFISPVEHHQRPAGINILPSLCLLRISVYVIHRLCLLE